MRILAIETSCDETAIAVLRASGGFKNPRFRILSNIVASQIKIHAKWGGVVPNLAKREHIKNLPVVLKKALAKSKIKIKDIDLIAVTIGPGLEPALWTGINFAKELAETWNKKIIGINHMEAHLFSAFLKDKSFVLRASDFEFPTIALLVSGGHTELVLIKDWLKYKIIGQTRDDAAGEAFDKVAKMLGLPYPGGPQVAKLANSRQSSVVSSQIKLPRPMINSKNYDFSFSGLKTAVLYLIKDLEKNYGLRVTNYELRAAICHEFQQAVVDVLVSKTIAAAKEYKVKTIILGGGVAANKELRKQLGEKIKEKLPVTSYLLPVTKFTTDNAAMIATAAYFHAIRKNFTEPKNLKADGNLILK